MTIFFLLFLPPAFRMNFGDIVVVILDCLEIKINTQSRLSGGGGEG